MSDYDDEGLRFTRGPWRAGDGKRDARWVIVADDGSTVASTISGVRMEANRNLMAAAPDLYAALSRMVARMERLSMDGLLTIGDEVALNRGRDVLAQARGDSETRTEPTNG